MSLRKKIGALIYDWPSFELRMRAGGDAWLRIRNRNERITVAPDGAGVRCDWRFTSELHIANVFPSAAVRLMRRALQRWPIAMRDAPAAVAENPEVSFLIGHRGVERLPQLLATCRSIAGQSIPIECIVVEQSRTPEVRDALPPWVRYIHTPLPQADLPYCRAWAFNVAARHARGGVFVLHDNDMLVPARYAAEALRLMRSGWAFVDLKRFLFYLPEAETLRLTSTQDVRATAATVVQNLLGGGSIIAERDAYFDIGGFDESFVGWGGEDNDFWDRACAFGRVRAFAFLPLIHLYHASQPGKLFGETAAVERYRRIEGIPPRERIERLRARRQGEMSGPAVD